MAVARVTTPREYFDGIVKPDYDDFRADTSNLRGAFHLANSLFNLRDWTFAHFSKSGESTHDGQTYKFGGDEGAYNATLESLCREFGHIRDVANASKHMALKKVSTTAKHATNTSSSSTGYGQGPYGQGPYGGAQTVKIKVGSNQFVYFSTVADEAFKVWVKLFTQNAW